MRFTQILRCTASVAALAAFAGVAHAQEVTSVDEIVVTAQKREQSLQDVPVVVTALSEETLQAAGVRDIKDLQILTPGLTVTSTSNETVTTARIRGVGTVGDNAGLESSVGIVIDGVYRPRNGVGFGDLGEMERIEVLKGPQGTLFGKNTSAGVINILTKAPEFDFGFAGEATVGNFGARGFAASVTGPLGAGDQAAGRLYVATRQRDGFYDVRTGVGPRTLTEDNDQSFTTIRGQLLLLPSETASFRIIADWTERDENCCAATQIRTGSVGPLVDILAGGTGAGGRGNSIPADPFERIAYANRNTEQAITDKGISLEANFDLAAWGASLTSITAFRSWETVNGQDSDFSGADILYRPNDGSFGNAFDTFSQEVRLAGETDRFNWLVGAFYASEDLTSKASLLYGSQYEPYLGNVLLGAVNNFVRFATAGAASINTAGGTTFVSDMTARAFGTNFVGGQGQRDTYTQENTTFALFTNNDFHVTDQFDINFGLRYTMDDKDTQFQYRNTDNGAACAAALGRTAQIGGLLVGRGVPVPLAATATSIAIGNLCLPWTNPGFNSSNLSQSSEENEWSGTIKGVYRWTDDFMTYASYARGYKAGGFNLDRSQSSNGQQSGASGVVPVNDTAFPGETVDSYELGMKSTLGGGSMLFNAAFFHQTYTDFQLNTFLGTSFIVDSIPEVKSVGVDADMLWLSPIPGVTLQGGVTFANTEYSNFGATDLKNVGRFPALALLPGSQVSFAPEWSWTGAINYDREIGHNLRLLGNLSGKYVSDYNTGSDLIPAKLQKGFGLVNGRIGIGSADERWTLEAWAVNLTDEDYYQVVFNGTLQGSAIPPYVTRHTPAEDTQTYDAFLGAPRTYGLTLRVKY